MKRIILTTTIIFTLIISLFSQAKKPTIMVFPADVWMTTNGYFKYVDNQGTQMQVMDYQKALDNNKELYSVITIIQTMMNERGFPLEDMASKLKDLAGQNALDNMDQNKDGGGIAESPRDKLLKIAKPDIVLEISWEVQTTGPKKTVSFQMKGLDSGTNKNIASQEGTGTPSFSSGINVLLKDVVLGVIDNFNAQLMTHFDDMFTNGREISLDVKVWDTSPKKLNDEINKDGDELKDDIIKWVKDNTLKGRYTLSNSSPNMMNFTQVRIPLYGDDNSAFDGDAFATKLRKYLRKTYQLQCESSAIGLGKAEVVIGGKR